MTAGIGHKVRNPVTTAKVPHDHEAAAKVVKTAGFQLNLLTF